MTRINHERLYWKMGRVITAAVKEKRIVKLWQESI